MSVTQSTTNEDLLVLLRAATDRQITEKMLFQIPWIFAGDAGAYGSWRTSVARGQPLLRAEGLFLVGSAAFGFSLSPLKPGRPFRRGNELADRSDIDVAIVSQHLFTDAWNDLVATDRARELGGGAEQRDKMRGEIYRGFIGEGRIWRGTRPAQIVRSAMAATTSQKPFRGHVAKARVYRRSIDLIEYHVHSLRALRLGVTP